MEEDDTPTTLPETPMHPNIHPKNEGRYDLAPVSNALNNVLNLRNIPDKEAICAEFEKQLTIILDASALAPAKWNELIDLDTQTPNQIYEGHTGL